MADIPITNHIWPMVPVTEQTKIVPHSTTLVHHQPTCKHSVKNLPCYFHHLTDIKVQNMSITWAILTQLCFLHGWPHATASRAGTLHELVQLANARSYYSHMAHNVATYFYHVPFQCANTELQLDILSFKANWQASNQCIKLRWKHGNRDCCVLLINQVTVHLRELSNDWIVKIKKINLSMTGMLHSNMECQLNSAIPHQSTVNNMVTFQCPF